MKIVIDIPEGVYEDIVAHDGENCEGAKSAYYFEKVIQNSTPLPKGHGRLIDADDVYDAFRPYVGFGVLYDVLDKLPTIIETDKEEG